MNEVIKQLRIHKGLTQRELAKRHPVSEVQQINSERSWFVALHLQDA